MPRVNPKDAAEVVRDAGGHIIGRTRFQKIAYLLWAAGLGRDFSFSYKHYGPYSDELALAVRDANLLGLVKETEHAASWGGTYSTYDYRQEDAGDPGRLAVGRVAANVDAVALELAATALFLRNEGWDTPWDETAKRKPEKAANGGIDRAKAFYARLSEIAVPNSWPALK